MFWMSNLCKIILLITLNICLLSCQRNQTSKDTHNSNATIFNLKEVIEKNTIYTQQYPAIDTSNISLATIDINYFVQQAYHQNNYAPIWFQSKHIKKSASLLPFQLLNLLDEGILMTHY